MWNEMKTKSIIELFLFKNVFSILKLKYNSHFFKVCALFSAIEINGTNRFKNFMKQNEVLSQ